MINVIIWVNKRYNHFRLEKENSKDFEHVALGVGTFIRNKKTKPYRTKITEIKIELFINI